jgi:hypothetical protein
MSLSWHWMLVLVNLSDIKYSDNNNFPGNVEVLLTNILIIRLLQVTDKLYHTIFIQFTFIWVSYERTQHMWWATLIWKADKNQGNNSLTIVINLPRMNSQWLLVNQSLSHFCLLRIFKNVIMPIWLAYLSVRWLWFTSTCVTSAYHLYSC